MEAAQTSHSGAFKPFQCLHMVQKSLNWCQNSYIIGPISVLCTLWLMVMVSPALDTLCCIFSWRARRIHTPHHRKSKLTYPPTDLCSHTQPPAWNIPFPPFFFFFWLFFPLLCSLSQDFLSVVERRHQTWNTCRGWGPRAGPRVPYSLPAFIFRRI